MSKDEPHADLPLSRRGLLLALGVGGLSRLLFAADRPASPGVDQALARAKSVGLGTFKTSESGRYIVLGDAPDAFRDAANEICEGVATDFLAHFKAKDFDVERPTEKLVVVVLSGPDEFAKFMGIPQEEATGGVYDLETNRLVILDNRARQDAGPNVARANTVALTHEATHQLCFNTSLLSRKADTPLAISEGLAMYAESRSPDGKPIKIGDVNRYRMQDLARAQAAGPSWIPLDELLTKDSLFDDPGTRGLADGESWLLVYTLMKALRLPAFRAYLKAISARKVDTQRLEDAKTHLGPLGPLDAAVRRSFTMLARR